MTTIDLDALTAELDPLRRGRRIPIDDVGAAVQRLAPHVPPDQVPDLIRETVQRGHESGHWTATQASVRRGRTALPRSVMVVGERRATDRRSPITVPLRPELAWAIALPLSAVQRDIVLAVNEWLRRTNGGQTPVVAAAERAYELLEDEKAFDPVPPKGGSTLWRDGRLTFDLLRCERIATPLTWEPTSEVLPEQGEVICVENHATFRTMLRALRGRAQPRWAAVAWIQGWNTAPLEWLADLPFHVTRLDYLGDLDAAGLEIAAAACAVVRGLGITAGPATVLWDLLVAQPSRPGRKVEPNRAAKLASWLPMSVRDHAADLLVNGRRVPQEAIRISLLGHLSEPGR